VNAQWRTKSLEEIIRGADGALFNQVTPREGGGVRSRPLKCVRMAPGGG